MHALEREIQRLVDAIATVGISPSLAQRLAQAEADLAQLRAEVSRAHCVARPPEQVAEALMQRYVSLVRDLGEIHGEENEPARYWQTRRS